MKRIFAALFFLLLDVAGVEAQLRYVPDTRVGLNPPPGFVASKTFPGFEHPELSASILVNELPAGAYQALRGGFTAEAFARKGIVVESIGRLDGFAGEHIYVRGRQNTGSLVVEKFILVVEGAASTAMITANVPIFALRGGGLAVSQIEAALASIVLADEVVAARRLFEFEDLGAFGEHTRLAGGVVLYSDGDPSDAKAAIFVTAPSLGRPPVDNPALSARQAFRRLANLSHHTIESEGPDELDGLAAYRIVGTARDAESRARKLIVQWLLLRQGGGYIRLVGIAPAERRAHYLAQFTRIAEGFRLRGD